uniref:Uncharacterized protein n=1 Tax=Kalanchoe fedtschenkoi TaxID=63787 RepID=A0A7N0UDY4_KALFE
MGRGRVELKRIENKINRQVTFSKRRTGLVKKAHEISVLCDAEVALIIFSGKGKMFEYSTDSCMEKILERYERHSYAERQHYQQMGASDHSPQEENITMEYHKLKSKLELLQRSHRHCLGEDVDSLSMRELQNLEHQLDTALKRVRARKNQLMHESISELQKKERAMQEQNNLLTKRVKEKEKTLMGQQEEAHPHPWAVHHEHHHNHGATSLSSFHSSQPVPSLNAAFAHRGEADDGRMSPNELDLTLEPIYSYHLGCYAA